MVEDFGLGCVLKGFIETALLRERISFYLSLNIKVGGGRGYEKDINCSRSTRWRKRRNYL